MCAGGGPAQGKSAIGVGPLRLWPGGLCLSRAIGDFDVGDSVLSLPYVSQVRDLRVVMGAILHLQILWGTVASAELLSQPE